MYSWSMVEMQLYVFRVDTPLESIFLGVGEERTTTMLCNHSREGQFGTIKTLDVTTRLVLTV